MSIDKEMGIFCLLPANNGFDQEESAHFSCGGPEN